MAGLVGEVVTGRIRRDDRVKIDKERSSENREKRGTASGLWEQGAKSMKNGWLSALSSC
jgi:hypothetical protein